MKCLIISEVSWPNGGGAELATHLYAKLLSESGLEVTVLSGSESRTQRRPEGYQIVPWAPRIPGGSKFHSLLKTVALLQGRYRRLLESSDVVYISKCCWAIPIAKLLRKPVLIAVHEFSPISSTAVMYPGETPSRGLNADFKRLLAHTRTRGVGVANAFVSTAMNLTLGQLYGRLLPLADSIVFVSRFQRDVVVEAMPQIESKSHVIYNPTPEVEAPPQEKEGYLYCGGTNPSKGFELLVDALDHLSGGISVGVAGRSNTTLLENHKDLVHYGWLPQSQYYNLLRRSLVTIFPSLWAEPAPYVIVESLLAGNFLIASDAGGVPEIVDGAPGVLLFPPGDSKALAEMIASTEEADRNEVREAGRGNRRYVTKKFPPAKALSSLLQVIDTIAR